MASPTSFMINPSDMQAPATGNQVGLSMTNPGSPTMSPLTALAMGQPQAGGAPPSAPAGGTAPAVAPPTPTQAAAPTIDHNIATPEGQQSFADEMNQHLGQYAGVTPPGAQFAWNGNPQQHLSDMTSNAMQTRTTVENAMSHLDAQAQAALTAGHAAIARGDLTTAQRARDQYEVVSKQIQDAIQHHALATGVLRIAGRTAHQPQTPAVQNQPAS